MDVRVLKYFLTVAREGNFTRAAELLHITQPTLSRQIMDLEEELNAELLVRGKRQATLTESGLLFQQRAMEIVSLLEKAERDIAEQNHLIAGVVSIGCVESIVSRELPVIISEFSKQYPMVQYDLYSANGDDIREKLDRGVIDIGILVEPVETAKYDFLRLPYVDRWGVLMRKEDPLAKRESLSAQDLLGLPLIISKREIVKDEIVSWFGSNAGQLRIFATHNLPTNSCLLVEHGLGYAVTLEGAYTIRENAALHFVPLIPERTEGHVLAWRKNRLLTPATERFMQYISIHIGHDC